MLYDSLKCREIPDHSESSVRHVVFSNVRISEPIQGSIFSLTPCGTTASASAYTLEARVYSPPIMEGVMVTPLEETLDDIRILLAYVLDIELHQDVDTCRILADGSAASRLGRLVPNRFDPTRRMHPNAIADPLVLLERVWSQADDHLLLVQRAARAYERGMLALMKGERDLAYALFVFVLECLAQVQPVPDQIHWEDYPASQRSKLDRVMGRSKIDDATAQEIRAVLASARHLRATENFREFVLASISEPFFDAAQAHIGQSSGRRLRRSLLPRLLLQAYDARSGFAHALAPLAEAVSAYSEDDFCPLRDGTIAFTFRGLHRVVREVMGKVLRERSAPPKEGSPDAFVCGELMRTAA